MTGDPEQLPADVAVAMEAIAASRRSVQALASNMMAERTATSPDATVVIVSAGGLLRSVTLDPRLTDTVGRAVDATAVTTQLLAAARDALTVAAPVPTSGPADVASIDPVVVAAFAERTFRGESAGGEVVATVDGGGLLTDVLLAASATRGEAAAQLGGYVLVAVNRAIVDYRTERARHFGLQDSSEALTAKTDAFVERMDAVAAQMSGMRAGLAAKLAEVEQLRRR